MGGAEGCQFCSDAASMKCWSWNGIRPVSLGLLWRPTDESVSLQIFGLVLWWLWPLGPYIANQANDTQEDHFSFSSTVYCWDELHGQSWPDSRLREQILSMVSWSSWGMQFWSKKLLVIIFGVISIIFLLSQFVKTLYRWIIPSAHTRTLMQKPIWEGTFYRPCEWRCYG